MKLFLLPHISSIGLKAKLSTIKLL
jgi:hypothetical protein